MAKELFFGWLISVPLTDSQLAKMNAALQECFGTVRAIHLDKTSLGDMVGEVISTMAALSPENSAMLILLSSPQCIAMNPPFLAALVRCWDRRMSCLVTLDEAHLWAMHGETFRNSNRIICNKFFTIFFSALCA